MVFSQKWSKFFCCVLWLLFTLLEGRKIALWGANFQSTSYKELLFFTPWQISYIYLSAVHMLSITFIFFSQSPCTMQTNFKVTSIIVDWTVHVSHHNGWWYFLRLNYQGKESFHFLWNFYQLSSWGSWKCWHCYCSMQTTNTWTGWVVNLWSPKGEVTTLFIAWCYWSHKISGKIRVAHHKPLLCLFWHCKILTLYIFLLFCLFGNTFTFFVVINTAEKGFRQQKRVSHLSLTDLADTEIRSSLFVWRWWWSQKRQKKE